MCVFSKKVVPVHVQSTGWLVPIYGHGMIDYTGDINCDVRGGWWVPSPSTGLTYEEQMRLDTVNWIARERPTHFHVSALAP
jgi:hypothetical protein